MGIWYDKKAYQLLKKCSDAKDLTEWNEYRKTTNYSPINLRFADLRNFYLQKAELQNIDLRGSYFTDADFRFADVINVNISSAISLTILTILFAFGLLIALYSINTGKPILNIFTTIGIIGFIVGSVLVASIITSAFISAMEAISTALVAISVSLLGAITAIIASVGIDKTLNTIILISNNTSLVIFLSVILVGSLDIFFTLIYMLIAAIGFEVKEKQLCLAKNPDKVIGFHRKYLLSKLTNITEELQKEASELNKAIETTHDDSEKEKLVLRQQELEDKIEFYSKQELDARIQQTRIENVISELQTPYVYIYQTVTKVQWHNRIFYMVIISFLVLFLYAILDGYFDQRITSFTSLFTKETQPTFGTIFGVILFYGTPVLLGISLIIYFIAQINKNIDKVTELQEQERNIKQIASTIKAKAQIGMSDEEFVKETKALIQKYQDGMMASMFSKEKIVDKEEKVSQATYREKMIANGVSKLIIQALKK